MGGYYNHFAPLERKQSRLHLQVESAKWRILVSSLLMTLIVLPASKSESLSTQTPSINKKISKHAAPSGFYLEIKRSYVRAYPGWQKKTISLLKSKGFLAFNGHPKKLSFSDKVVNMESIEKTSKPISLVSSVYAGPYLTADEAEHMIPIVLAALKPLIDAEKRNDELHNRFLFLVGVVRVL